MIRHLLDYYRTRHVLLHRVAELERENTALIEQVAQSGSNAAELLLEGARHERNARGLILTDIQEALGMSTKDLWIAIPAVATRLRLEGERLRGTLAYQTIEVARWQNRAWAMWRLAQRRRVRDSQKLADVVLDEGGDRNSIGDGDVAGLRLRIRPARACDVQGHGVASRRHVGVTRVGQRRSAQVSEVPSPGRYVA